MSEWKAKRFWTTTGVRETEGGFTISLDDRGVKTPGKTDLTLPTRALADAIAAEWDAQEGEIDPMTMPLTRAANSALDKVIPQHAEVAEMLAAYGGTDLLCYRAEAPVELATRQAAAWDPVLDWVEGQFGLRLNVGTGVMHVAQPKGTQQVLGAPLRDADAYRLTALHDLVTLSGSLVLALAVSHEHLSADQAWDLSRIDETFQNEQWGIDDEAAAAAAAKKAAFLTADRLLQLL